MRNKMVRCAMAGICLLWTIGTAHAAEIKWSGTFADALASAKKTNRLVMVDFYTDWCGWCKRLDKDTYTSANVVSLSEKFVPVKVNAEKEGVKEAAKYNVHGYPAILFLDGDGTVIGKIGGYEPPEAFAASMNKVLQVQKEEPVLEARYRSSPKDAEAAAQLAVIYAGQDKAELAAKTLAAAEAADPKNAALPAAYNAIADTYQEAQEPDKAIPLFRKAVAAGTNPQDIAYAHISIAYCYLMQEKLDAAKPELKAVAAVPNCPADLKAQAEGILAKIAAQEAKK